MGYSISIRVQSKALGQRMIDFLKEHGKSWQTMVSDNGGKVQELVGSAEPWYYGPFWAKGEWDEDSESRGGLSYIHRRGHLGFDYGVAREYKYTLLRWMATKIGTPDPETGFPRYLYDDGEWFVLPPENYEFGISHEMSAFGRFEIEVNIPLDVFREEMKRLDDLWDKLDTRNPSPG